MAACGVTMEKLQQKGLHGDDRIEKSVSPLGIADRLTCCENGLGLELIGPLSLEVL
jgi:hypothetical protein